MSERTNTPASLGNPCHEPSVSNRASTDNSFVLDQISDGFDADIGPYDPDNDYLPE